MAKTVAQIQDDLGEYIAPGADFTRKLAQALDRLYSMGTWKDTTYGVSYDASLGYIALENDKDSVLAATVNDFPRPVRSLWHDVRIFGRQAQVSDYTGVVDDGYHATARELVAATDTLRLIRSGGIASSYPADFTGSVTLTTNAVNDGGWNETTSDDTGTVVQIAAADDFDTIRSIEYTGITAYLDLIDPDEPDTVIATIPPGSGVLRVRRFRTPRKVNGTTVNLLVKRACPDYLSDNTIVHLDNKGTLKHALLGVLFEDEADYEKSEFHWGKCGQILDTELKAIMGQAKPVLRVDLSGAGAAPAITNLL